MAEPQTIIVASGNAGKVREIGRILADLPLRLATLTEVFGTCPDIPETGDTFEANARMKAAWVFEKTGTWTLADDSGLMVDALDGQPGVRSARYAGEKAGDAKNLAKLLEALRVCPEHLRTARFHCCMALMTGPENVTIAEGECCGSIIDSPRGNGGFGYDPVFVPHGYAHTFAEIDEAVKNSISHRARALQNIREGLVRLYDRH